MARNNCHLLSVVVTHNQHCMKSWITGLKATTKPTKPLLKLMGYHLVLLMSVNGWMTMAATIKSRFKLRQPPKRSMLRRLRIVHIGSWDAATWYDLPLAIAQFLHISKQAITNNQRPKVIVHYIMCTIDTLFINDRKRCQAPENIWLPKPSSAKKLNNPFVNPNACVKSIRRPLQVNMLFETFWKLFCTSQLYYIY